MRKEEKRQVGEYLTPLDVRQWGKDRWVLLDWFGYVTFVRGRAEEIWVPPGYITDLASIPPFAQIALPVDGPYRAAAIPHDWLFDTQDQHDFTLEEVNEIMAEAMRTNGRKFYIPRAPTWQRVLINGALSVSGWYPWRRNLSHKYRDDGLHNPTPGGPRGDFEAAAHARSGRAEVDAGGTGQSHGSGINTPRVP